MQISCSHTFTLYLYNVHTLKASQENHYQEKQAMGKDKSIADITIIQGDL